jgi:hypothetical protein
MRTRFRYVAIDDVRPGMVLGAAAYAQDHGVLGLTFPGGLVLSQESIDQLWAHQAEYVEIEEPDPRSDDEVARDAVQVEQNLARLFSSLDLSQPCLAGLFQQLVAYRSGQ